jgi:2-dehydro-3-deoxyphosphogluconate aldolase/(4S)-4-hydroxy-2-oxoglutarate aldolase
LHPGAANCNLDRLNMHSRQETVEAIERAGIVGIIRLKDPSAVRAIVDALVEGGVRALEITMTVPGAVDLIRSIAPEMPEDFILGAGTVTDAATAERVIDAGARFVVSPVYRASIVAACRKRDVPSLPGCFTPTEILDAWEAGADIVKVFPATALGPAFFRDIRGPLPQIKLMPTGGVTLDNAGDWIRAGAVAVGVGSALLDSAAISAGQFGTITANARRVVASVSKAREAR